MLPIIPATARLSDFGAPTNRILFGENLKKVRAISRSIQRYGLFNPIIVMKDGGKLVVIDGRKRITALRRMRFQGKLPRSLVRIPYIVIEQCRKLEPEEAKNPLLLLSNAEQYEHVQDLTRRGRTMGEIAKILFTTKVFVRGMLAVDRLSQKMKGLFFGNQLTFDQARALATIPSRKMQDVILQALGPFASAKDILNTSARLQVAMKRRKQQMKRRENMDNIVRLPKSIVQYEALKVAA